MVMKALTVGPEQATLNFKSFVGLLLLPQAKPMPQNFKIKGLNLFCRALGFFYYPILKGAGSRFLPSVKDGGI